MAEQLTVLAVRAHPDDEIAVGGTLAKYHEQGIRTVLVTCTGGEEGEIVDPTLDIEEVKPRLREVREQELRCAAGLLGIDAVELLGYRDSGMAGTPANNDPASFHMADPEEATGRLVRLIRRYRPQVLISDDENGGYGHPDHIKDYLITGMAFDAASDPARYPQAGPPWQPQKLYYCGLARGQFARWRALATELGIETPWLRQPEPGEPPRGLDDARVTTVVDVAPYLERKREAMRCHRTQIRQDTFAFQIPEEMARQAFGQEFYIRVRSLLEAPDREDDLFAGMR